MDKLMKRLRKYNGLKSARDVARLLYDSDNFLLSACNPKYCEKTKDGKICPGHTCEDCINAIEKYLKEDVEDDE